MENENKEKIGFILKIDLWAEKKGPKWKFLWQVLKYGIVSSLAGIIQIVLVNILFRLFDDFNAPLSPLLSNIFSTEVVGKDNSNWGYVLTFFLSNALANTFAYFMNKKKTFRSDAPMYHFILYIIVVILLVFLMTWIQGVLVHYLTDTFNLKNFAPTIATVSTAFLQGLLLFPLQKFVLLREKKKSDELKPNCNTR